MITIEELLSARQKIELTNIRLSSLPQKAIEIEERASTGEMMGHDKYKRIGRRIRKIEGVVIG